jgi:hypothetical protein
MASGTAFLSTRSLAQGGGCTTPYPNNTYQMAITGLPSFADVLMTFEPSTAALGLAVPALPEGFQGINHFDTYWGLLSHPFTFANAQPLQCSYPAVPPKPGDFLTVADTVPTPAVGEGVYYVTAASYLGQARFGRRYMNGAFSGRDPSVLPACQ